MVSPAPNSRDEVSGDEEDYDAGDPCGDGSGGREHDEDDDRDDAEHLHRYREAFQASVGVVLAGDVEQEADYQSENYQEAADARGHVSTKRSPEREYSTGDGLASGRNLATGWSTDNRVASDEGIHSSF